MLRTNNVIKRSFTKNAVLLESNKSSLDWDNFVNSLNTKNEKINQNRKPFNENNRRRNYDNKRNFNGSNSQNRNFNRKRNVEAVGKVNRSKSEIESIKLTGPNKEAETSKKEKDLSGEIDLSFFDAVEAQGSDSLKTNTRRENQPNRFNNRERNMNFKNRRQPEYKVSPEKMFEGHNFGVKKFNIAAAEEQHTNRLPYYKLKNDAKVNVKTALNFFKKNSVYEHEDAFFNPELIINHERDALMYTPRIISSKEHVLRDTSFEVFKSLANEFNYRKEKTKTLLAMNNWTALPEGTDINSPEYDYVDRYMLHQEVTRGSTFEGVYLNAMRAVRTDSTLVADKMRINSILAGKYDQDFLPKSSIKSLSEYQNKYKGKFAPNVVKNIHKTGEMLANVLNFSPTFMNDSSRKQEVFDYLTLNKPFGDILASKREILRGHSPQKKEK
ncbi:uncharacterized protein HGUI_01536 [Hanseniaspora guilliermondii]|uniref:Uncharacterized protein n=1 Tax=Hanseniaspora guilliermondii TaxID=56406 RepID=A0A1L0AZ05_9ASCO|nr:uncharacterized protein HGUI_01536 [Hanseniaspora guilliermondii]